MSHYFTSKKRNKILKYSPIWLSLLSIAVIIYDFGVNQYQQFQAAFNSLYTLTLLSSIVLTIIRAINKKTRPRFKVVVFDIISIIFFSLIISSHFDWFHLSSLGFFSKQGWVYAAIFLAFLREVSSLNLDFKKTYLNPAQLFIASFLGIILLGALALMLPKATVDSLSFMDALFTATSAVCVTGLVVVDTGSYFTIFGQIIILVLIQIGGLGIMTFASYFSYFFRGDTSYKNQLILSDLTTSNKLGEVFNTLKKIIITTLSIELIGAVLIFTYLDESFSNRFFDQAFFAVFHSISAFCNAGFSTLTDSLSGVGFQYNYPLQLTIIILFIIGGLGFPIVFNLSRFLNYLIREKLIRRIINKDSGAVTVPWVLTLNSRIVIITSIILIVMGSATVFVFEYNNTLSEHSLFGKLVTALFTATTPRTAGFNTIDLNSLKFSTIMLIFLLMWIGASPASTGGGIKTNTFAIATLNFWSLARGKERLELFRREISELSVRRAFAIISLSLVVIGAGVFLIASFDSEKDLLSIAFECFSAYSTVGLSLGITADLSHASKFVIIGIMFIGRVSMLSILIAIVTKEKRKNYRYSKEEVLIN